MVLTPGEKFRADEENAFLCQRVRHWESSRASNQRLQRLLRSQKVICTLWIKGFTLSKVVNNTMATVRNRSWCNVSTESPQPRPLAPRTASYKVVQSLLSALPLCHEWTWSDIEPVPRRKLALRLAGLQGCAPSQLLFSLSYQVCGILSMVTGNELRSAWLA